MVTVGKSETGTDLIVLSEPAPSNIFTCNKINLSRHFNLFEIAVCSLIQALRELIVPAGWPVLASLT
jgi:hypothetical protein